jgi:hypothetical protein
VKALAQPNSRNMHTVTTRILRTALLGTSIVLGALAVLFALWALSERGLPFNTEGRYFDGDIVHLEQDCLGLATVAVAFLVGSLLALSSWVCLRQKGEGKS